MGHPCGQRCERVAGPGGRPGLRLYALSTETGALRWRLATARPIQASPAASNGVVYVADLGGRVYAVEHHGGM
ncbi:outer membrane protein assembly factor BamB family protein [Streptomyces melanogenes]|uniref:outer membrane protein assembly factor BamB family protein n=1 Tax=Streptomyces melanogenes TaxID=67326 RepID=UPI003570CBE1